MLNFKILTIIVLIFVTTLKVLASGTNNGLTNLGISITSTGKNQKWKSVPIHICVHESMPDYAKKSVTDAVGIWNKSFEKRIFINDCTSKNKMKIGDLGNNEIFWLTKNFDKYTNKTSVARTIRSFDEDSGEIVDADIIINAEYFDWKKTKVDLTTVLVHELGHVLSLQHNFISANSPMNYYPYQSGIRRRQLSKSEINIINHFYFNKTEKISDYLDAYLKGDSQKAIKILSAKKVDKSEYCYALGKLNYYIKNYSDSEKYFKLFLKESPKDLSTLYYLGDIYWSKDNVSEAKKYFLETLKINPNYYESLANLGAIEHKNGNLKIATTYFKKVLEIIPVHYVSCYYLYLISKDAKYLNCVKKYAPPDFLN